MATPTNYSACVRIQVLNFSQDKIFVVNAQSAKTAKIFNLENFRLYGIDMKIEVLIILHGALSINYIQYLCNLYVLPIAKSVARIWHPAGPNISFMTLLL